MRHSVLLLLFLYALIYISYIEALTEVKQVSNVQDMDNCEEQCATNVDLLDSYSMQADGNTGPNRIATHLYALGGWGVAAISAGATLASLLVPVEVNLKSGQLPDERKCQSGGFGFRDDRGVFYNINISFEVKNGVKCGVTATRDVVKLATKGAFDQLNKMGFAAGSIKYEHDNGDWSAWVDVVTGENQPTPPPVEDREYKTWYWSTPPEVNN